jgi:hypothetical protein
MRKALFELAAWQSLDGPARVEAVSMPAEEERREGNDVHGLPNRDDAGAHSGPPWFAYDFRAADMMKVAVNL